MGIKRKTDRQTDRLQIYGIFIKMWFIVVAFNKD